MEPRAKRRYGYYVLPVLHGERLIGRIAPRFDRRSAVLTVEGLYAEPDAPASAAEPVAEAVAALAAFLGARTITYGGPVPDAWRTALHSR
ncbi:crosslink repair DNA glycosylase YcaQ family protein [Streptosporangium sp. NPDC048047]|uniref:DNA glycosylase AlkZ-like family protein n=1 Tax=Streptosporangium sp. NPDC048047 TaxID=3155748 RepID=UPI00341B43A7